MIDIGVATTEIRRLSRLKNYPRSWEQTGDADAREQDSQAEAALMDAAAAAPDVPTLRRWVNDWERSHIEAPAPAVLYESWRNHGRPQRYRQCDSCGGSGWVTRYFVKSFIDERDEKIYIGESEVDDWWKRIRSTPTCAQRVYEEAVRCGCSPGNQQQANSEHPAEKKGVGRLERPSNADWAMRAAGGDQ